MSRAALTLVCYGFATNKKRGLAMRHERISGLAGLLRPGISRSQARIDLATAAARDDRDNGHS
jgi:hypothetical protein